jgi:hypothetical protein
MVANSLRRAEPECVASNETGMSDNRWFQKRLSDSAIKVFGMRPGVGKKIHILLIESAFPEAPD